MKVLANFLVVFTISCSLITDNSSKQPDPSFYWSILESSLEKKWSQSDFLKKLGPPNEKFKQSKNNNAISWFYSNKKNNFQEWVLSFDSKGILNGVSYFPNKPITSHFTIQKILKRWDTLNCVEKVKRILKPHVIQNEKYLSCSNGKKIINYNKYNEVESISVKK